MIGIDEIIVILWFLPAFILITLLLINVCFTILYALFGVFKPVAGQKGAIYKKKIEIKT